MKLILLLFTILPTISYAQFNLTNLRSYHSTIGSMYNPNDNFHIGIVTRMSGASILNRETYDKVILLNTTMLEFLFGHKDAFFYTSARFSTPLIPSSDKDQQNHVVSTINDLKVGVAVGGGYGINNQNPYTGIGHGFNIILVLTADTSLYSKTRDIMKEKIFDLLTFGTEIMLRYQYYYRQHSSLVLGFDVGMSIKPQKDSTATLSNYFSNIIITYGGVFGFRF